MKPRPVTIRGVVYPSARAAGQVFGVAPNTVRGAARRGTLDNVGLGRSWGGCMQAIPTLYRGTLYASQREAARQNNVPAWKVFNDIEAGLC